MSEAKPVMNPDYGIGFVLFNKPEVRFNTSNDRWWIETVKGERFLASERELACWQALCRQHETIVALQAQVAELHAKAAQPQSAQQQQQSAKSQSNKKG